MSNQQLLEKYWAGETTLEEEALIRTRLAEANEEISPVERQYFQRLNQFRNLSAGIDFTDELRENTTVGRNNTARRYSLINLRRIAAILLVALGLSGIWWSVKPTPNTEETISQEEIEQSYQEARQALLLISSKLNKGADYVQKIDNLEKTISVVRRK